MKKLILFNLLAIFLCVKVDSQTPYMSEQVIKYDFITQKVDKPLPFDKAFTLLIEKSGIKDVIKVEANQVVRRKGSVDFALTKTRTGCRAIRDTSFHFFQDKDQLYIYVQPLKPNVEFNLHIIYKLSKEYKAELFKILHSIYQNTTGDTIKDKENEKSFDDLRKKTEDKYSRSTAFSLNYVELKKTFTNKAFVDTFTYLTRHENLIKSNQLLLREIQAATRLINKSKLENKETYYFVSLIKTNALEDAQLGLINCLKPYNKNLKVKEHNFDDRIQNLDGFISLIDTLLIKVDKSIAFNNVVDTVDKVEIKIDEVKVKLIELKTNATKNLSIIKRRTNAIHRFIDEEANLYLEAAVSANNVPSDLKTSGANYFTISIGMANIGARKVNDATEFAEMYQYIPKLYYGISLHFIPVDKNTRRSTLPRKKNLKINVDDSKKANLRDCGILSRRNILQKLSLNIGFTTGAMFNKDFDNFLNNTSLLLGPSYRIGRVFSISAGGSLMRRNSFNPVISEKKPVLGLYASIAIDIDFIQGVKDIYSVLLK